MFLCASCMMSTHVGDQVLDVYGFCKSCGGVFKPRVQAKRLLKAVDGRFCPCDPHNAVKDTCSRYRI